MTEARAISDGVDLKALIERVREAKGRDPELDIDLCLALGYIGYVDAPLNLRRAEDGWVDYESIEDGHTVQCSDIAPALSSSIDAALALVERLLPGWVVEHIGADAVGAPMQMTTIGWTVELAFGSPLALDGAQGQAPTLPLAIVAALLSALTSLSEDPTHAK